jgi:transposase InsO family protein
MDTQAPARLQSDNGKEFIALIILELCKAFGVKPVNGSIGRPQSQGAVERCNRSIKDKISAQLLLSPTIEWSYQVHPLPAACAHAAVWLQLRHIRLYAACCTLCFLVLSSRLLPPHTA